MIIVKIMGGLGNQLFQYAFGRNIAIKHNTTLKLDTSYFKNQYSNPSHAIYELSNFNIYASIANVDELPYRRRYPSSNKYKALLHNIAFNEMRIKKEGRFHFDAKVLKYSNNVYIEGYWQSEKYFKSIDTVLKKELTFSHEISIEQKKTLELIERNNSVSVHIRRGDYISTSSSREIYSVCSIKYYQDAVEKLLESIREPVFFIFSNDMDWVKENIEFPYKCYYVTGNKAWVDLKLMSHCKNHIIANSTFSWWGAYLSNNKNKKIIAPIEWFTKNVQFDTSDLIPDEWIRL